MLPGRVTTSCADWRAAHRTGHRGAERSGMPWWAWGVVGLVAVVLTGWFARRYFRRDARRALVAHLREAVPGLTLLEEHEDRLVVRTPDGGEGPVFLQRFYADMAAAPAPEAQRVVLERWAALVEEGRELQGALSLEEHGPRVLPRLVAASFFDAPMDVPMPRRPLDDTGLWVVYVLDSPQSVAYLTDEHARDLGLDPDALHRLALDNLARRTPEALLDQATRGDHVVHVALGDTYEAARLLLLPGRLVEGQARAAVVPDRDTLIVSAAPPDGDWSELRRLARVAGDRPLLDRPLLVTADGFDLA